MNRRKVMIGTRKHVLILEGYCKQCLPFIRGFKEFGCEVSVLCGSRLDCGYASRLPDHKILGVCDLYKPEESEDYIVDLIKTGRYDIVFPLFDMSARILATHFDELKKYAFICANTKEIYGKASDKLEVMKACEGLGIPHPKTAFDVLDIQDIKESGLCYPLIIKPRSLYGARGFRRFDTANSLERCLKERHIKLNDYVVQEQIPEDSSLVTCVLYIDRNGDIKSSYLYKSAHFYPIEGGTSTLNGIMERKDIIENCKRLVNFMKLRGLVGIDLMVDNRDNIGKIIEINARCVHGITLGIEVGVNHAQQILEDAIGQQVTAMAPIRDDVCCRIFQTDVLWWLSSPKRFQLTPQKLGYKKVKEQMFYWDDPLPWFAFLFGGLKDFRRKMKEKKGYYEYNFFRIGRARVFVTNYDDTISCIRSTILSNKKGYICVSNVRTIAIDNNDDGYHKVMDNSLMNTPDGTPLIWCARLWGIKKAERVCGPTLFERALSEIKFRHFFLGDTEEILKRVEVQAAISHDTFVVGTYSPPFAPLDEYDIEGIANKINASGANVVWTALTAPKQDLLNVRLMPFLKDGIVLIGIGAAFRTYIGELVLPSGIISKMGLSGLLMIRKDSSIWKELVWYAKHSCLLLKYLGMIMVRRMVGRKYWE